VNKLVRERWETMSLPQMQDGRSYVTGLLAVSQPHVAEMVRGTPEAWERPCVNRDIIVAKEPGEIPVRICVQEWEFED
jgi:hypothetical protein